MKKQDIINAINNKLIALDKESKETTGRYLAAYKLLNLENGCEILGGIADQPTPYYIQTKLKKGWNDEYRTIDIKLERQTKAYLLALLGGF